MMQLYSLPKCCNLVDNRQKQRRNRVTTHTHIHCARQPCYCRFATGDWSAAGQPVSLAYSGDVCGLSGRCYEIDHAHRALISERACERTGRASRWRRVWYRFVNLHQRAANPDAFDRKLSHAMRADQRRASSNATKSRPYQRVHSLCASNRGRACSSTSAPGRQGFGGWAGLKSKAASPSGVCTCRGYST